VEKAKYDELKAFYRVQLDQKIDVEGMEKSQFLVLEGLLRLRQAACHQGLLDEALQKKSSSKIDLLIEQLEEVVNGNHKALVFSQFASLLRLIKPKLEKKGWSYEYLDGKTRKRQEKVTRFQEDPNCKIFLISLKAGGVGLNLTAADYCYLLDPWWNPAAEAQAIDRTHRIGQNKTVFAYRLISRNTVEEKVLALQAKKRDLAQAFLTNDGSMLKKLSKSDLQFIFS
jgi:SNF2 family DNA or RNA helicase